MAGDSNLVSQWSWADKHVQQRDQVSESRFVNAATVLICAGPPRLAGPGVSATHSGGTAEAAPGTGFDNLLFPIGVCMDANISQARALQRLYEIGSDRCYFVQGRNSGGITLNRVFFNGASLMRVLYAYYPNARIPALGGSATADAGTVLNQDAAYEGSTSGSSSDDTALAAAAVGTASDLQKYTGESALPQIELNPGYNNMFVNLASDLFNHPLGLSFMFQDVHKHTFAAFYCEMCMVQSHGLSIGANGSTIIGESVQLQFDRIAPIKIT